jgi:hypothetical protein
MDYIQSPNLCTFKEHRNQFQGIYSASVCILGAVIFKLLGVSGIFSKESIPWNQFLCSLNVYKFGLCTFNFQTKKFKMATRKTSRKLSVDLARKISAISVASDVSGISERYRNPKHLATMDF